MIWVHNSILGQWNYRDENNHFPLSGTPQGGDGIGVGLEGWIGFWERGREVYMARIRWTQRGTGFSVRFLGK